jgi:hypothetical protein
MAVHYERNTLSDFMRELKLTPTVGVIHIRALNALKRSPPVLDRSSALARGSFP